MLLLVLSVIVATLRVSPTNLVEGATVHVMCRITPHPDNRAIEVGIGEYMRSSRELEGERAPRTFEFHFPQVPCGVETAYCAVMQTRDRVEMKQQKLTIIGCEVP